MVEDVFIERRCLHLCQVSVNHRRPWCSPGGVAARLERQEEVTPVHSQLRQSFHCYGSLFLKLVHIVSHTLRVLFGFLFFFFILGKGFFDLHRKFCIKLLHPSQSLIKLSLFF